MTSASKFLSDGVYPASPIRALLDAQRVQPHFGHDACEDIALLPAIEREVGTVAQITEELKSECIRPETPLTPEDARLIQQYVDHYNTVRLHSAIGFITPADMLAGRQAEIHKARDRKLEEARQQRQKRRQKAA